MKHEWTDETITSEAGARVQSAISYCRACGLMVSRRYDARTRRASALYGMPIAGKDTIASLDEPACVPSTERRTRAPMTFVMETKAPDFRADFIGEDGGAPPITREQWRDMSNMTRMVHVSRYTGGSSNPYGYRPLAWCGAELSSVSWVTVGLVTEGSQFEPGDAVCADCARKSRLGDKWIRKMLA
jgi:hypothetical protein